jgi:hypothetical protein
MLCEFECTACGDEHLGEGGPFFPIFLWLPRLEAVRARIEGWLGGAR